MNPAPRLQELDNLMAYVAFDLPYDFLPRTWSSLNSWSVSNTQAIIQYLPSYASSCGPEFLQIPHLLLVNYSRGKSFPSYINISPSLHFFFPRSPWLKSSSLKPFLYFYFFPPSLSDFIQTHSVVWREVCLRCTSSSFTLSVVSPSSHVYVWLLTPVAEEFCNVLCSVKYVSWSFFCSLSLFCTPSWFFYESLKGR